MEIETVAPRNQRERLIEIGPQLVWRPGPPRIISRHGQATADGVPLLLESTHIVPLPAVERDGNRLQSLESLLNVDAEGGISLPGELPGGIDLLRGDLDGGSGSAGHKQISRSGVGRAGRKESAGRQSF